MIDRKRIGAAVVAMALSLSPALAEDLETPAGDRQKQIDALIAELSSPDAAARQEATRKLVEMGPDAQAALEAFISGRSAAEQALQMIESQKVAGPTLITLELNDATPTEALRQLSEKSGYSIEPYRDNNWENAGLPNITLNVTDAPFWDVLFEMMKQGEFALYPHHNEGGGIRVMPQRNVGHNWINAPRSSQGAFVVLAQSIQRNNSVDLSKPDEINRNLSAQLQVLTEPKVNIIRYNYQPDMKEAVDDKGNSLVRSQSGSGTSTTNRQIAWNISAPLQYPEDPGSQIKTLRGEIAVTVQTRSETLEVEDILTTEQVTRNIGDLNIIIDRAEQSGDRYSVKMVVRRSGSMDQQQFYALINDRSAMQLLDANGNAWRYGGGSSSSRGDRAEITTQFYNRGGSSPAGEPVKLVWEIATGSHVINVPFEFTDLPLP